MTDLIVLNEDTLICDECWAEARPALEQEPGLVPQGRVSTGDCNRCGRSAARAERGRHGPEMDAPAPRIRMIGQSGNLCAERPARPGELCKCGRPAVIVYETEKFGDVGYCGIPDEGRLAR